MKKDKNLSLSSFARSVTVTVSFPAFSRSSLSTMAGFIKILALAFVASVALAQPLIPRAPSMTGLTVVSNLQQLSLVYQDLTVSSGLLSDTVTNLLGNLLIQHDSS